MYSVSFFDNLRPFQIPKNPQIMFISVSTRFVEGIIRTLCGLIISALLMSTFHLRKEMQLE